MSGPLKVTDVPYDDRFRQVVEASPAGVLLVDAEGRIRLVNHQIEAWFGYRREELLGLPVECLIPERIRTSHFDLKHGYLSRPDVRHMGSGRDLYARRKDGSEFPCDISLHPLETEEGPQVMVHVVDVTELRRLEAERRQQETHRRLRFMVENLPAGAAYVSGDAIQVNRATEAMTGYSRSELTTLDEWFSVLFRQRAAEMRARFLGDREANFGQTRMWEIVRRDGQTRWIEQTAFRDEEDEVWLLHDVTDQMQAQLQVVQAERLAAIGQMMTALAHESRNALQRAQACLEMLELDLEDRPELLNLARRAQAAVDELQRLYEEVRGYAAPMTLEIREWNLQAVCEEVWSNLKTSRGDKSIELTTRAEGVATVCRVDRHRFAQVLRNIFDNSISALPMQGGRIDVTYSAGVEPKESRLRISIRDNGPGLTPEQRVRIFEPFYTTKSRGTGLGMAIAKRIMEAHGGDIAVGRSESGTEIVLCLPR
jgi:PAS domain S-box-containing protein